MALTSRFKRIVPTKNLVQISRDVSAMCILYLISSFMQLAGTRDAIRLYVETQLFALDTVTRLILDSGIAWQAPNVYEHRDSK